MIARTALCIVLFSVVGPALATDLAFSSKDGRAVDVRIKDPENNVSYSVSLSPERDVKGRPVVLDLSLSRADSPIGSRNLLEPKGNWHGAEPFGFAAREFRHGLKSSVFGSRREIPIQDTQRVLLVSIRSSQIAFCNAFCVDPAFGGLKLSISIEAPSQ